MKSSISPDPFSPAKSPKLVLHSLGDGHLGAESNSYSLPCTSSDEHLFCLPVSQPLPAFNLNPVPDKDGFGRQKYLAAAWDMLKPAIKIILDDEYESVDISCTRIYWAVGRACLGDPGKVNVQLQLFDLIKQEREPHISAVLQSLEKQSSDDPSVFLPLVYKCWLDFKRKMTFVSDLAMYRTCNDYTLWDVCQRLFHKQLSMVPQLQDQVFTCILRLITDERSSKTANNTSDLLKNLMNMFRGVSKNEFEKPFLDSTYMFYAKQSEQVLQQSDISQDSFRAEQEICKKHDIFFAVDGPRLIEALVSQLLEAHACFLGEGFKLLMDESLIDDLRRMYCFFSNTERLDYIDRILRSYILAKGEGARQ